MFISSIISITLFIGAMAISNGESAAFKSVGCDFFEPQNAAKLLGEKFRGEDQGMKESATEKSWGCTFMRTEETSTRSPKIYFSIKKSVSIDSAVDAFSEMRKSNSGKPGWEEWSGVGDEASTHTDAPNFHLVTVRKGAKTIVIKINPADGILLSDVKTISEKLTTKL